MALGRELASPKGGKEKGRQADCAGAGLVPTGNAGHVEKQGPWGRLVGGRRADDVVFSDLAAILLETLWKFSVRYIKLICTLVNFLVLQYSQFPRASQMDVLIPLSSVVQ